MTTTGMTTSCSWNRVTAAGSARRTLVSRTKVWHFGEVGGRVFALFFTATVVSSVSPRASCAGPQSSVRVGRLGSGASINTLRRYVRRRRSAGTTRPFPCDGWDGGEVASGAEATLARSVGTHGAQQVDAAEGRPQRIAEV